MLKKNNLYLLGTITLLGFPIVGFAIQFIIERQLEFDYLKIHSTDLPTILAGLLFGFSFALIAERISEIEFISKSTYDLSKFLKDLKLDYFDVFFLSFAAGFGEEILFRGILQPYLGIWITSIVFIAIHGYLNIKKPGMFVFGLFLVLFSNLLGYLNQEYSIWGAIAAHFSYDFFLLISLKKSTNFT